MAQPFIHYSIIFTLREKDKDNQYKEIRFKNLTLEEVTKYREEAFIYGIRVQETARSWFVIAPWDIKRIQIIGEN